MWLGTQGIGFHTVRVADFVVVAQDLELRMFKSSCCYLRIWYTSCTAEMLSQSALLKYGVALSGLLPEIELTHPDRESPVEHLLETGWKHIQINS